MRRILLALLVPVSVGGCATGYASDWFRDKPSIINPQLIRFGMNVEQSRCVSDKLGKRLSLQKLRQLQLRAAAVGRGAEPTARYSLSDLRAVASTFRETEVRLELDSAASACGVTELPAPVLASGMPTTTPAEGNVPLTSGGVPVDTSSLGRSGTSGIGAIGAGGATWLNLGAAESGQSIAIDAMSIQQEGATRVAWFRMTDPENGGQTNNSYRLRIDCQAKTVQPLALRQTDASGAQVSLREYAAGEAAAGAAEAGTVLEIAYLSLCT